MKHFLFGMRGYPAGPVGPDTLEVSNVTQVLLFVTTPRGITILRWRISAPGASTPRPRPG